MPQARKTISSVEESSKGFVYGYISNDGKPVLEVREKEHDLIDDAEEALSSDSLLDF
ncbi:uncharacterized protein [Blastocystis hominis]|uniref:Uncharacterized protein n=1 Tax=Blastocystis hominis TaxID=12968 RepID=D8M7F2_BLAHO|nr:uncharacterized protein [Blastocystis hominis]CBK23991.2 unnamed protein product [Blastocystis hominis]|eukprot:XP_012898039.1 uncharacterized protein [Blastocystis hominis]